MSGTTRRLETLELVGGALCLDFANTVNVRPAPEHDYLLGYSDLVGWAQKVGILSPSLAGQLQKQAKKNASEAESVLHEARGMRELLYRLFSHIADGSEPDDGDKQVLMRAYGEAVSNGQLTKEDQHYKTAWNVGRSLDAILWPIVHSAGELLLSEELRQVKECPSCGWLFLDTSKNQSRRWCSMSTCGARDKMRRYHKRKQSE